LADTSTGLLGIKTAVPEGNPFYNIYWLAKKYEEQRIINKITQTQPSHPKAQVHSYIATDKVRLHRYICLWWASERKLVKRPVTKPKNAIKNQGNRARHSATKEATSKVSGWFLKVLKRAGPSSN
jgi:hypothetical protein